ncbi:MAG: SWIM zinc finger family protein [Novosphingobium sp.]|nr:SWIM zinc finger family protein [Novosphingobium sp.]
MYKKPKAKPNQNVDDVIFVDRITSLFGDEVVRVESESEPGKFYDVNKTAKTCTCLYYRKRKGLCKHLKSVLGIFEKQREMMQKRDKNIVVYSKSLLKSATQKAVRRNDAERAIVCAKAAIYVDVCDFARRVPVIIMEDALLHPKFDEVLEITKRASRKSYEINDADSDLLIQVIYDCANIKVRDDFLFVNEDVEKARASLYDRTLTKRDMTEKEESLVRAIRYRSKIGGLSFDVKLMSDMANVWQYRFEYGGWTYEKLTNVWVKTNDLKFKDIRKITENDISLPSVDFHCSPILRILNKKEAIVSLIKKLFPDYANDTYKILQEVMWKMRSSINYKIQFNGEKVDFLVEKYCDNPFYGEEIKNKFQEIFNQIEKECDSISQWYIKAQFKK